MKQIKSTMLIRLTCKGVITKNAKVMKNLFGITAAALLTVANFTNEATASDTFSQKGAQLLMQKEASPTPAQQAWLKASDLNDRIKMAEQIGDDGARRLARSKGWVPILEEGKKSFPQGPDQIYRGKNGIVHVVEAKGGSSQLGHAYGYPQGSPEWAVKSSERIVTSRTAIELEKQAAREVLRAAAKGQLEVHVIRTSHVLGEPTSVTIEQSVKCTKQAAQLATTSLEKMAQTGATAGCNDLSSSKTAGRAKAIEIKGSEFESSQLARSAGTIARTAGKTLAVVAVVASPIQAYDGIQEIKQGETVKGSMNLGGSAANATSAIAGLAGRRLLSGGAGAVGAGVDGAIDIYTGVKNHDAEKISVGGVKSAAAIAMGVGTATVQPEVVIPAAVVYGGAVVTDVVYQNRKVIGDTLSAASESVKESAANGYKKSKQCIENSVLFQMSEGWFLGSYNGGDSE